MHLIVMLLTCIFFLTISQREEPQMIGPIMIHEEIRRDMRLDNSIIHVIMNSLVNIEQDNWNFYHMFCMVEAKHVV